MVAISGKREEDEACTSDNAGQGDGDHESDHEALHSDALRDLSGVRNRVSSLTHVSKEQSASVTLVFVCWLAPAVEVSVRGTFTMAPPGTARTASERTDTQAGSMTLISYVVVLWDLFITLS